MNSILKFMGDDHDRLDKIFAEFRKTKNADLSRAKLLFHDFKTGLQRHIVWEEEILFPLFEDKTGMREAGPTAVMRIEHRQIRDFLEAMHNNIREGNNKIADLENGFIEILTDHNNKEEEILYPWIDNSVSDSERDKALIKMKELPPEKFNQCCGMIA